MLRAGLIVINVIILASGAVLCVLGAEIDNFLSMKMELSVTPQLWWTGLGPVCIGFAGVITAAIGQRKWVLMWVGGASVLGILCYCYMSAVGCLDAARYGVALQVYGDCSVHGDKCLCWRADGNVIALAFASCSDTHYITTLYLIMLGTLLLCVSSGVAATILACIATICIDYCGYKLADCFAAIYSETMAQILGRHDMPTTLALQSPMHLKLPGRTTSMLSMSSLPPSPTCMSELNIPSKFQFLSPEGHSVY